MSALLFKRKNKWEWPLGKPDFYSVLWPNIKSKTNTLDDGWEKGSVNHTSCVAWDWKGLKMKLKVASWFHIYFLQDEKLQVHFIFIFYKVKSCKWVSYLFSTRWKVASGFNIYLLKGEKLQVGFIFIFCKVKSCKCV